MLAPEVSVGESKIERQVMNAKGMSCTAHSLFSLGRITTTVQGVGLQAGEVVEIGWG